MTQNDIGKIISKYFEGYGVYIGIVVDIINDYYTIIYEDGDIEDITKNEFNKNKYDINLLNSEIILLLRKLSSNYYRNINYNGNNYIRYILKEFPGHGMYYGIVESFNLPYYKIRYEDNDTEELEQREVESYSVPIDKVPKETKENLNKLIDPKRKLSIKNDKKRKELELSYRNNGSKNTTTTNTTTTTTTNNNNNSITTNTSTEKIGDVEIISQSKKKKRISDDNIKLSDENDIILKKSESKTPSSSSSSSDIMPRLKIDKNMNEDNKDNNNGVNNPILQTELETDEIICNKTNNDSNNDNNMNSELSTSMISSGSIDTFCQDPETSNMEIPTAPNSPIYNVNYVDNFLNSLEIELKIDEKKDEENKSSEMFNIESTIISKTDFHSNNSLNIEINPCISIEIDKKNNDNDLLDDNNTNTSSSSQDMFQYSLSQYTPPTLPTLSSLISSSSSLSNPPINITTNNSKDFNDTKSNILVSNSLSKSSNASLSSLLPASLVSKLSSTPKEKILSPTIDSDKSSSTTSTTSSTIPIVAIESSQTTLETIEEPSLPAVPTPLIEEPTTTIKPIEPPIENPNSTTPKTTKKTKSSSSSSSTKVTPNSTPQKNPNEVQTTIQYVKKKFPKFGDFYGVVVDFISPYYKIIYEDGDVEEYSKTDLKKYLFKDDIPTSVKKSLDKKLTEYNKRK